MNVRKEFLWGLGLTAGLLLLMLYWTEAKASHPDINIDNSVTNNYYGDEGGCPLCMNSGFSDKAFAQALTQAYASGAHELDWNTTDIQISVTYALQFDGEEEDAYSFKVGKKALFGEKFLRQGMFHLTLNPEVEDLGNTAIFGATFRIP